MSEELPDIKPDLAHKFTHEHLHECSPSSRDGMTLEHQHYCRRMYVSLIQEAGQILKVPQPTICTAIMFCHRYYAVRSMVKNDKFIMAAASLLLAGKADERPKSLRDVMRTCFEVRYSKRPKELDKIVDAGLMDYLKEKIVFAERALVYAIGFDFDVQHPHETAVKYIEHFRLENCVKFPPNASLPPESGVVWPKFNHFSYIVLTMLNDSYRCLVGLQYPAEQIAVAVIFLALRTMKANTPPRSDNKQWYEVVGVQPEVIMDICGQLVDLYNNSQKQIEAVVAQNPFAVEAVDASAAAQHTNSQVMLALEACAGSDGRASQELEQAACGQTPTELHSVGETSTALHVPAVDPTRSPLHMQAPPSSTWDVGNCEADVPVVSHCSPSQNGSKASLVMV